MKCLATDAPIDLSLHFTKGKGSGLTFPSTSTVGRPTDRNLLFGGGSRPGVRVQLFLEKKEVIALNEIIKLNVVDTAKSGETFFYDIEVNTVAGENHLIECKTNKPFAEELANEIQMAITKYKHSMHIKN